MVLLVQFPDATWNLPVITSGDDAPPSDDSFSFPAIEHLVLVDVGLDVHTPGYEVQATEISLEMAVAPSDTRRVTGPLRMSQPARITWGERQTAIEALDARLAFDEDSLEIDSLVARLPEGRFTIDGWVRWVSGDPTLDLAYDGTIALASAVDWWRADRADNNVTGEAIVTGTVTGPVREPRVSSHIEAGAVRWGDVSGLDLRADVLVDSGGVSIEQAHARYGGGTVDAAGRVSIGEMARPSRVEATWRDIDTGSLLSQLTPELSSIPAGIVSGRGALAWDAWHPSAVELTADMRSRAAAARAGWVPFAGAVLLELDSGHWRVDLDGLAVPGMTVRGQVDGSLAGSDEPLGETTVAGAVTADVTDVTRVASTFGLVGNGGSVPIGIQGTGAIDLTLSGTLREPVAHGHIRGAQVGMPSMDNIGLEAAFVVDRNRIEFDELTGELGVNLFEGDLSFGFEDARIGGTLDVTLSEIARLAATLPEAIAPKGHVAGQIVLGGRLTEPKLQAAFEGRDITIAGRDIERFTTTLGIDGDVVSVEAEVPALNATARAKVGVSRDTSFELTAELQQTDLRAIGLGFPDASGIASLALRATGDHHSLAEARIEAELTELDGALGPTRVRLIAPGGVEYRAGRVTTERIELLLNDSRLTLAGGLGSGPDSRLTATLSGDLSDMESVAGWLASPSAPPAVKLDGAVETNVVVTGSFLEPEVSAQVNVRDGTVAIASFPPVQSLNLDASYDSQMITLNELAATWQGASVGGEGELPAILLDAQLPAFLTGPPQDSPQGHVRLAFDEITSDALEPFLDPETLGDLETHASARLEIEIDGLALEDARAVLSFGRLELTAAAVPLSQRQETRLELREGTLNVRVDLGNEDDYFTLGGDIDLRAPPLADLTVTADLDLRAASAFIPDAVTDGDAFLIANIVGPVSDPDVNGTPELTDAGIRMQEPQLIVSDVNGALLLTRDTIQFHELTGDANGGPLAVSGALDLIGLRPEGEVLIVGRGVAMELPEGVRTELDTDLTFVLSADELSLRGDVTVTRGEYREALLLTGGLLAALQEREAVTVVGLEDESPFEAISLNVRIATAEDIVIDNNYADALVGFDLRVLGTAESPALTGRAAVAEGGRIRLGNRVYEIENGSVDFVDPIGIEPDLNITARTRVSGRDITLSISGVPDALSTSFQSDGGESESDIVSLLLTGRTVEEVGLAPEMAAADQALGLVSTEVLGTAGRSVGLDTLQVEQEVSSGQIRFDASLIASETDPSTRLTVGKNLSDQVQLIASQDLQESGRLTWIIEYLPRRNIELRLVLDDVNDKAYEFRHALSLGGRRQTTPVPRRELRVGTVQLVGNLGVPDADLRSRLRLREGDRFDFYRWQQDRDELERSTPSAAFWNRGCVPGAPSRTMAR